MNEIIIDLQRELSEAREQVARLRAALEEIDTFAPETYPLEKNYTMFGAFNLALGKYLAAKIAREALQAAVLAGDEGGA